MATEIERKFLVTGDGWRAQAASSKRIRQAYLAWGKVQLRVRLIDDAKGVLTVKSARNGLVRSEYEYPVPVGDALQMLELRTGLVIEKVRHLVPAGDGLTWEIDVFAGPHAGLVTAEIELTAPDQHFSRPDWLGDEVTNDPRFFNVRLALGDAAG